MPSPFPGMDPYLEDARLWPDVQSRLINAMSELIADEVSPNFTVHIEERGYAASFAELRRQTTAPGISVPRREAQPTSRSTTAVISPHTQVMPLHDSQSHDWFITILDAANREPVAILELLSPANKTSGSTGREHFLRKRQAVLASETHRIEVDLLRAGERPPESAGRGDYCSVLARSDRAGGYDVRDSNLRDVLPTIAVPLRPPFADVPLDLQQAIAMVYARGRYEDKIDYTRPVPAPTLRPADVIWVAGRVREWREAHANGPA